MSDYWNGYLQKKKKILVKNFTDDNKKQRTNRTISGKWPNVVLSGANEELAYIAQFSQQSELVAQQEPARVLLQGDLQLGQAGEKKSRAYSPASVQHASEVRHYVLRSERISIRWDRAHRSRGRRKQSYTQDETTRILPEAAHLQFTSEYNLLFYSERYVSTTCWRNLRFYHSSEMLVNQINRFSSSKDTSLCARALLFRAVKARMYVL